MKNVKVIINEQHSLMDEQVNILNEKFSDNWEIFPVPANGWTLEEMKKVYEELKDGYIVIFASPIPYLIRELSYGLGLDHGSDGYVKNGASMVLIFHNDKREKKELPNGKIIQTVAQTGWQLI